MRALILQFSGYGLASTAAFALDVSLLWLLVNVAGWHYLLAAATSFLAGGVLLHRLSVKFVFSERRVADETLELSYFLGLGLAGLAINSAIMFLAVDRFGAHLLVAKLCAAMCTVGANFLLRKQFLFTGGVVE